MTTHRRRTKIEFLLELRNDPERKPLSQMIYELFYLMLKQKEIPRHYFSRYLFKKGITNLTDYLPNNLVK